ncbi:MAG: hypothetical protein JNK55_20715 [Rubrivivax sp.]|nr:hypothetical protein [Rubrivivax sp.]
MEPAISHIEIYAATFFAISRSIFTRASSALSLASSICSGVTDRSPRIGSFAVTSLFSAKRFSA